jgi:hypothetical protein
MRHRRGVGSRCPSTFTNHHARKRRVAGHAVLRDTSAIGCAIQQMMANPIRVRCPNLWRGVDQNGRVLDLLMQRRRDKRAAKKFSRKLLNPWPTCRG